LRLILEELLDFDFIVVDAINLIILDDSLPTDKSPESAWMRDARTLGAFVRTRMKSYLCNKYTHAANTLVVWLLDPEIEKLLADNGLKELDLEKCEKMMRALGNEVGKLPPSATQPALLTTVSLRQAVRELIANDFSHVPVLCYQELSAYLNIQPIARISL